VFLAGALLTLSPWLIRNVCGRITRVSRGDLDLRQGSLDRGQVQRWKRATTSRESYQQTIAGVPTRFREQFLADQRFGFATFPAA
jgi:hypothetical protein